MQTITDINYHYRLFDGKNQGLSPSLFLVITLILFGLASTCILRSSWKISEI